MNSLDRINDGVAQTRTIPDSIVRLIENIAGEILAAAGNEQASGSLAAMLLAEAARIGLRVLANTPMILATPPVHPDPAAPAAADPDADPAA